MNCQCGTCLALAERFRVECLSRALRAPISGRNRGGWYFSGRPAVSCACTAAVTSRGHRSERRELGFFASFPDCLVSSPRVGVILPSHPLSTADSRCNPGLALFRCNLPDEPQCCRRHEVRQRHVRRDGRNPDTLRLARAHVDSDLDLLRGGLVHSILLAVFSRYQYIIHDSMMVLVLHRYISPQNCPRSARKPIARSEAR